MTTAFKISRRSMRMRDSELEDPERSAGLSIIYGADDIILVIARLSGALFVYPTTTSGPSASKYSAHIRDELSKQETQIPRVTLLGFSALSTGGRRAVSRRSHRLHVPGKEQECIRLVPRYNWFVGAGKPPHRFIYVRNTVRSTVCLSVENNIRGGAAMS